MPNRGELRVREARAQTAAARSDEAWLVVGFCAISALISIGFAVSLHGVNALPGLLAQIPWG